MYIMLVASTRYVVDIQSLAVQILKISAS